MVWECVVLGSCLGRGFWARKMRGGERASERASVRAFEDWGSVIWV